MVFREPHSPIVRVGNKGTEAFSNVTVFTLRTSISPSRRRKVGMMRKLSRQMTQSNRYHCAVFFHMKSSVLIVLRSITNVSVLSNPLTCNIAKVSTRPSVCYHSIKCENICKRDTDNEILSNVNHTDDWIYHFPSL